MSTSHKGKKTNPKKGKSLIKLINKSDSDTDSEHELSYYLDDRVKLMKEVLKIIKPKKIKSMAPKWIRSLDMEEINSMLFEELLGISNKRLKGIFIGQTQEEDSSSTDPEEENKPIDIISLDDITDDDFINLDSDEGSKSKRKKSGKIRVKQESKKKKVKKEKHDKSPKKSQGPKKDKADEQNLMSVLELLELQARARAIRSQLTLEIQKKAELAKNNKATGEISDNEDAVIIESPKNIEIVITSSESESEQSKKSSSESNINHRREIGKNSQSNENGKSVSESDKDVNLFSTEFIKNSLNEIEKNRDKPEDGVDTEIVSKNSNHQETDTNKCNESLKSVARLDTTIRNKEDIEVQDVASCTNGLSVIDTEQGTCKTQNKIQVHKIKILRKGETSTENATAGARNENEVEDQQAATTVLSDTNGRNLNEEKQTSDIVKDNNECEESSNSKDNRSESTTHAENLREGVDITDVRGPNNEPRTAKTSDKIRIQKVRVFRKRKKSDDSNSKSESEGNEAASKPKIANSEKPSKKQEKTKDIAVDSANIEENDGIIINMDQAEIECIICD